jgi:hypothetical protein
MSELRLTADEKVILRFFRENRFGDVEKLAELTPERRSEAARSLNAKGLVLAHFQEGGNVVSARLSNAGDAYLSINPNLDDPTSIEAERQQARINVLQIDDLEHKAKIRAQESVIRHWALFGAILGFVGVAVWMLRKFAF